MKKGFRIILWAVLTVLIYALCVNFIVVGMGNQYILAPEEVDRDYDCILVLGCLVNEDVPSDMLRDRLDRAIALYKEGISETILMSGDRLSHGEYDEVTVMQNYALEQGVPQEAIQVDGSGFSTMESVSNLRNTTQYGRVLVVTQKYHLYRALYCARKLGIEAYGVDAMPNRYVHALYNFGREILARNKDFLLVHAIQRANGGDVSKVQVEEQESDIYTDEDIQAAVQVILADFSQDFSGCSLLRIAYAGDERVKSEQKYYADIYPGQEILVLNSDYYVGKHGGDGSLQTDSTYKNWSWMLRRKPGGKWKHFDHGYG